jgi:hypothetical protein
MGAGMRHAQCSPPPSPCLALNRLFAVMPYST